jgi:hypothetical protein
MQQITVEKPDADPAQIMDAILAAHSTSARVTDGVADEDHLRVEATASEVTVFVADDEDAGAIEALVRAHQAGPTPPDPRIAVVDRLATTLGLAASDTRDLKNLFGIDE